MLRPTSPRGDKPPLGFSMLAHMPWLRGKFDIYRENTPPTPTLPRAGGREILDSYLALSSRLTKLHVRQVWADYDREADVLYLGFRKPQRAKKTVEMNDNVLIRTDDDEVVGITILNASSRDSS